MKKIITLFCWFYIVFSIQAQQIYPVKESYDQRLEPFYSAIDYDNNATSWWQGWGWTSHSYLRMYQATHDKAYLNKFIKHSYGIQLNRGSAPPDWSNEIPDEEEMLYTGLLLRPMAEFIYIVNEDNALYNTNLMSGLIPSTIGGQTILGYGDYANWLQGRVVETLDHFNDEYWINDTKCYNERPVSECSGPCDAAVINYQSSFAAALFFIGHTDPNYYTDYVDNKAEKIVTFFRNRVTEYTPNHSYTWFHDNTPVFREDVTHGATDIQIPIVAYLLGEGAYTLSEMNKFSPTFTHNIWDSGDPQFHNSVFGTDDEVSDDQAMCGGNIEVNGTPNFYGPGEILAWMPLYPFEDDDDIYYQLLEQVVNLLEDSPYAYLPSGYSTYCGATTHNLSGTQSLQGLSEVVIAQWANECVNLTLYNRDVVYSQDFDVNNTIIVAPAQVDDLHSSNSNAFADPIITDDKFVIESGVTVNMIAGESIELHAGFEAKAGSVFTASISSSACTDGSRLANPNGNANNNQGHSTSIEIASASLNEEAHKKTQSKEFNNKASLKVFPNPFNEATNISFSIKEKGNAILKITDQYGREVFNKTQTEQGNYSFQFEGQNLLRGVYYCTLQVDDQIVQTGKIILIK